MLWICCTLILISAQVARAQHYGGGHRNTASVSGPTPETRNSNLSELERAVALQATPEQVVQFRQLRASTQSAQRRAQALLQLSPSAPRPEWIHSTHPLSSDIEEALAENERFVLSFSKEQKDGLKKLSKRLQKTDSEINSHSRTLNRDLENDAVGGEQIAGVIAKLEKALDDFQSQQLAIANEMGIQPQPTAR